MFLGRLQNDNGIVDATSAGNTQLSQGVTTHDLSTVDVYVVTAPTSYAFLTFC